MRFLNQKGDISDHYFVVSGENSIQGYDKYRVELTEETHIEDDPNFVCKNYYNPQDYDACLEEGYVREVFKVEEKKSVENSTFFFFYFDVFP